MSDRSRVWYFHAFFIVVWPTVILGGGGVLAVEAVFPSVAEVAVRAGGVLLFGATILAAFGSLVGYYEEAKHFRETGSEWVPTWWAYTAAHVLLTPVIVAPMYVVQRWRHVGLRSA